MTAPGKLAIPAARKAMAVIVIVMVAALVNGKDTVGLIDAVSDDATG